MGPNIISWLLCKSLKNVNLLGFFYGNEWGLKNQLRKEWLYFDDTLDTFYLVEVKEYFDMELILLLLLLWCFFLISSKGSFTCTIPDRLVHMTFVTPLVELRGYVMGWWVLGSHLDSGFSPEQVFKGPVGRL